VLSFLITVDKFESLWKGLDHFSDVFTYMFEFLISLSIHLQVTSKPIDTGVFFIIHQFYLYRLIALIAEVCDQFAY